MFASVEERPEPSPLVPYSREVHTLAGSFSDFVQGHQLTMCCERGILRVFDESPFICGRHMALTFWEFSTPASRLITGKIHANFARSNSVISVLASTRAPNVKRRCSRSILQIPPALTKSQFYADRFRRHGSRPRRTALRARLLSAVTRCFCKGHHLPRRNARWQRRARLEQRQVQARLLPNRQ